MYLSTVPSQKEAAASSPFQVSLVEKDRRFLKDKQVISTPEPDKQTKPDSAKYLSEYNSSTDAETQKIGQFSPHKGGGPAEKQKAMIKELKRKQRASKKTTKSTQQKLVNLFPSPQASQPPIVSGNQDYLEDLEQDAITSLNTWQWRYSSFFNRMKEAVSRVWSPYNAIQQFDPKGIQVRGRSFISEVLVTINTKGELVGIELSRSCQVYFLDDEALRAFRAAAPFANPPKALFSGKTTFSFNFAFHVSAESGMQFDMNWRPY